MVVDGTTAQRSLQTAGVAPTGVGHDTSVVGDGRHDGELLVAYLHIIDREVEVQTAVEEVQMGAEFEVPRLLWLIGDDLFDIVVVLWGMLHVVVATHGVLLMRIEVGLQDLGEHLDVVAASTVAFRHEGVDVAELLVEGIGQGELRQQLCV